MARRLLEVEDELIKNNVDFLIETERRHGRDMALCAAHAMLAASAVLLKSMIGPATASKIFYDMFERCAEECVDNGQQK